MSKSKLQKILFEVYWKGYSDGGLAEFDELSMREQHTKERVRRRKAIIDEALQKICPTKHAPDVAKAAAQKGVLRKNRSGKRAGVA